MNFIKGFAITLAYIVLCILVFAVAGGIGLYLFAQFESLLAFFGAIAVAFIVLWAMHGGFLFGMARKVVRHDDAQ